MLFLINIFYGYEPSNGPLLKSDKFIRNSAVHCFTEVHRKNFPTGDVVSPIWKYFISGSKLSHVWDENEKMSANISSTIFRISRYVFVLVGLIMWTMMGAEFLYSYRITRKHLNLIISKQKMIRFQFTQNRMRFKYCRIVLVR